MPAADDKGQVRVGGQPELENFAPTEWELMFSPDATSDTDLHRQAADLRVLLTR